MPFPTLSFSMQMKPGRISKPALPSYKTNCFESNASVILITWHLECGKAHFLTRTCHSVTSGGSSEFALRAQFRLMDLLAEAHTAPFRTNHFLNQIQAPRCACLDLTVPSHHRGEGSSGLRQKRPTPRLGQVRASGHPSGVLF